MKLQGLKRLAANLYHERTWYRTRALGVVAGGVVRGYRPLLRRCEFIAVTGSCGKTTAKELIAGVLGAHWPGTRTPENLNQYYHIAVALLAVRPWHRFTVQEAGIGKYGPGLLDVTLGLVRPTIGVVTSIGSDHISSYGSIEAIAREKRKVVEALPASGAAILNADDPHVIAMRDHCKARVLTFGTGPHADLRAEDVSSVWPERLSFTAIHAGERVRVQTSMCGEHYLSGSLAAIGVGLAMGLSLAQAATGITAVPPFANRMQPAERDDGVTFVFDDAKSPAWTIPAAFAFMRNARAGRRIIVMGTLSDYTGSSNKAYATVAREALASADHVVFVGTRASKAMVARKCSTDPPLHGFYAIGAACDHLAEVFQPGDLVLLKGIPNDGLEKIFAARPRSQPRSGEEQGGITAAEGAGLWTQVVVGLGNPAEQYRNSPHNVGHTVVDVLAEFFGVPWTEVPEARVATVPFDGGSLHLVKPRVNVNDSGAALEALRSRLPFAAEDCVLVHDDLNFDAGIVKARLSGNDGGHNGARSVLAALRSIAVRRVKVGVGRPAPGTTVQAHVLTPMTGEPLSRMETACVVAAHRVLTQLAIPPHAHAPMLAHRAAFERLHPHTAVEAEKPAAHRSVAPAGP